MKKFTAILSVLLIGCMMFGSSVFAASSDNARVVSAIRGVDSGLADIAEQFLEADAAKGKTLTADQADQMIGIIGEATPTFQAAMNGDKSDANYNALVSYFTRAMSVANISATFEKIAGGSVKVTVTDNDTKVSAGFQASATKGASSVSGSWVSSTGAVNYVGKTAVDNTGFIAAGVLGVLAIASAGFVVYRRKTSLV